MPWSVRFSVWLAQGIRERGELDPIPWLMAFLGLFCPSLFPHSTRVSYFAVFDGHGGVRASKFAAQNLHQNLIKKFPKGRGVE